MLKDKNVENPNLLQILVEINQWENIHLNEFQTASGRELYFGIAANLLGNSGGKPRPLKFLHSRMTERTARIRIREFERLGLIEVTQSEHSARSKQVIPTAKFLLRLNQHLKSFKQICAKRHLMFERA